MNKVISSTSNGILEAMRGISKVRPADATTIYRVRWCLRSDSFDGMMSRISSSATPMRLEKTRSFVSKDKAQELLNQLQAAFKVLDYGMEGMAYIEEDFYE